VAQTDRASQTARQEASKRGAGLPLYNALEEEAAIAKRTELSLKDALKIQQELYVGFKDAAFQKKLAALGTVHRKGSDDFLAARSALFLTVQREVLPRYGFEASPTGIVDMLNAAARWNSNKEYSTNRDNLNRLLGLLPPESAKPKAKRSLDQIRREANLGRLASSGRSFETRLREKSGISRGNALALAAVAKQALDSVDSDEDKVSEARSESPPPLIATEDIEVVVQEAFGEKSLKVTVPGNATYMDMREAISKQIGQTDILSKGHFVRKADDTYQPHRNDELVGDKREVLIMSYNLGPS